MYKHNGIKYPPYVPPSDAALLEMHTKAEKVFEYAFKELGWNLSEYYIDFHRLNDAFIRTDQRVLHYLMYHNGMKMNELKRIAVFSYWMVRFKPVHRVSGGPIDVNEQVVVSWFFKAVRNYQTKKGLSVVNFSEKLKKDLLYAITYRDISYDYMTMMIEGLVA